MKTMKVGDLRRALDGVADDLEIVVRASEERDDGDVEICVGIVGAEVEYAHDEDDTPYFAIDAQNELDDVDRVLKLVK
jgi:hypothetical protein